jgi:hypothetical protein
VNHRDALKDEVLMRVQGEGLLAFLQTLGFQIHRKGREPAILCPYHSDTNPSLTINLPGQKSPGGILYCHACKSGGDVFKFVQDTQGFDNFRDTLDFMAYRLGISTEKPKEGTGKKLEVKQVVITASCSLMPTTEVYATFKAIREHRIEPGPYCNDLGIAPESLEAWGAFIAKVRKNEQTGRVEGGHGCLALVGPQRYASGEISSVRFRSLEKREPGEKARRWSLDANKPGTKEQEKYTNAGLMCPASYFDEPPAAGQVSVIVEGESDLSAGITLMLEYGSDPKAWPARFIALPGVNNCHDMLTKALVGDHACTFMDQDRAGRTAVFDHKPRVCELCGRKVTHSERCRYKPKGVVGECGGRALIDTAAPLLPGLLSMLQGQGVRAMAAFPPPGPNGKKVDLRDLVRAGWKWPQIYNHMLSTGTKKARQAV